MVPQTLRHEASADQGYTYGAPFGFPRFQCVVYDNHGFKVLDSTQSLQGLSPEV
jgi:hypothetical protein